MKKSFGKKLACMVAVAGVILFTAPLTAYAASTCDEAGYYACAAPLDDFPPIKVGDT